MRLDDQAEAIPVVGAPKLEPKSELHGGHPEPQVHLVVVTSRAIEDENPSRTEGALRTKFWHPRDRCWSENDFESLEHARNLFEKESGWVLRQEQALDAPLAVEWIFEANRKDFDAASPEQILEEIGMTPDGVERLLADVEPSGPELPPDREREGGGQAR
jgi:hypothetical protein